MFRTNRITLKIPCVPSILFALLVGLSSAGPAHAQAQFQNALNSEVSLGHGQQTTVAGNPSDFSKKHILFLHAYTFETAVYQIVDPIFVKGFVEAGIRRFNLHFEFMDLAKHPDPEHRRDFGKYLSRKFEKHPIDLIIALHSPAFDFLVKEGNHFFPGIPVINMIAASEFLQNEDLLSAYESRIHPSNRCFVRELQRRPGRNPIQPSRSGSEDQ